MQPDPPLQPTLWRTCRVLANRRRLQILRLLAGGRELTVTTVARQLEIATPVASQSPRALRAGFPPLFSAGLGRRALSFPGLSLSPQ